MNTVEARLNSKTPDQIIGLHRALRVQVEKVISKEEDETGENLNFLRAIAGNSSIASVMDSEMNRVYADNLNRAVYKRVIVMGKLALRMNVAISRKIKAGEIAMGEAVDKMVQGARR